MDRQQKVARRWPSFKSNFTARRGKKIWFTWLGKKHRMPIPGRGPSEMWHGRVDNNDTAQRDGTWRWTVEEKQKRSKREGEEKQRRNRMEVEEKERRPGLSRVLRVAHSAEPLKLPLIVRHITHATSLFVPHNET